MRACVMRDGQLVVDEVPDPQPGPGQLLVGTLACGICGSISTSCGMPRPWWVCRAARTVPRGPGSDTRPAVDLGSDIVMGHEFCAEVLEAGPDSEGPPVGTPVVSIPLLITESGVRQLAYNNEYPGGFSERMLLSAPLVLPVPNGLRHVWLRSTEPLAVGIHAVAAGDVTERHAAAVAGCGPVGLAVIAGLRLKGVEVIVASDFSPARRALALQMGATEVVDPEEESLLDAWRRVDGSRQLVCFEAVGAPGSSTR